jgi:hypothetical protein
MKTYQGASTLTVEGGTEIRAGADLKGNERTWGGYLTIDTENWDLVKNLWSGRIRLPSGVEGAFNRPNRESAPPRFDLPIFRIRIEGNSDAPF